VAISNRRLISIDDRGVTFKWKDYRIEGPERYNQMTLDPHEFIRRFLMHVLPAGFHRERPQSVPRFRPRLSRQCSTDSRAPSPWTPLDAAHSRTYFIVIF
jgi:hypothetical protein